MEAVSRARRNAAVLSLALGGFAVGLTEFVAMGLLPEMAQGLLPAEYARSTSDAVAQTGWTITVYALGVVVGAPTIAALTARVPRKRLVIGLLALFAVGTVASALAPTFPLVLLARFVAALPHGAYFGAAGMVAAALIGPGSQAKGFAAVLTGLTAANVFGVPLITSLGQATSWRIAYAAIAGMFVLTLLAVLATVPSIAAAPGGSPRAELSAFRSPQMWLAASIGAIGFAGFFAVYSYISPVTTNTAGLTSGAVPWVLATIGLGMTVGNLLGGMLGDRNVRRSIVLGLGSVVLAATAFALSASHPVGLFVTGFLVGAACLVTAPALQARLIEVAPRAQLMGAAINQSATNIGNSLGAALGGLVIARGLGYTAPAWVGATLAAAGLAIAVVSFRLDRHHPAPVNADSATPNRTPSDSAARSAGDGSASARVGGGDGGGAAAEGARSAGARTPAARP